MTRRWLLAVLLPAATLAGSTGGRAQAPDAPAEVRKAAEQLVDSVELESLRGEAWVKVKRQETVHCAVIGFVPEGTDDFAALIIASQEVPVWAVLTLAGWVWHGRSAGKLAMNLRIVDRR